jgi:hypothetical protein
MSIKIDITPEEAKLLINILGQIHVKPTEPNALEVVTLVQSILRKIALEPMEA